MTRKPGQWWDKSWSVVTGCSWPDGEEPEGCRRCWARSLVRRFPAAHDGLSAPMEPHQRTVEFGTVLCHPDRLDEPLRHRKPTIYAVSLLGDLFHPDVPSEFILRAWMIMRDKEQHRFAGLTKRWDRAENLICHWLLPAEGLARLPVRSVPQKHPGNIILLASVWDQASTDAACAAFQGLPIQWGLHMEPLIGHVDLERWLSVCDSHGEPSGPRCRPDGSALLSWIVVGPENGPGKRPCDPKWIEIIEAQCHEAGVPVWRKASDGPKEVPAGWGRRQGEQAGKLGLEGL